MKKIECKYCGWSWNESDGGDDKYMCHMCDNDNSKYYLKESEQPKKGKLFIPRRLSGENSRFIQWNKEQPIVDGVQINQYTHDGKPIGYWDNWVDDNDILVGKGLFVKGKKEGYWEEYLDGELVGKGSYKNGKESGIWEFYEDGEVYRKELFQSGKLVGRWYPSKDTLDESEESKKGKLFIPRRLSGENSRFIQWNKEQPIVDGERINQYTHDGKKIGIWEYYYENGQLSSKFSFKDGKYDGIWESYHDNGQLSSKGSFKDGEKEGYWEEYYDNGQSYSKGLYKDDKKDGIWEWYYKNGQLDMRGSFKDDKKDGIWEYYYYNGQLAFKDGKLIKKLPLTESEQPKKGKLFIPRRIEGRWDDYLKSTITTDYNIRPYLERRDLYKDNSKNIDPLVMKLSKGDLITFVKANPFWLNSLDKVEYLLNTLNYKENKDIAENHIGQILSGGQGFFTTPELKYYENKFKIPKSNYGKIDTYVFVGSDEFKETRRGSYKKVFDIERLMKVSVDDWKDTRDYGIGATIKMMRLRAGANNKQLFKISAHKGLLDDYEGETGSEMPDYILMSIDQKKERL
jgi:antitoxin component YwqK of YwqJK toxin-antitoxin module